jgi:hypothetical protein
MKIATKAFEFTKTLAKRGGRFPSSYWSTHFSDLHGVLFKSDKQPHAAFQKDFVQIWEMCRPIGRKGSKFKREQCTYSKSAKACGEFKREQCTYSKSAKACGEFKSFWCSEAKNVFIQNTVILKGQLKNNK